MDIDDIKLKVKSAQYVYTLHAEIERRADDLTFYQIEEAVLSGDVLEQYADEGRGESCLIIGFSDRIPIHVVCGRRGNSISIITVYVPKPPKVVDPWTRSRKHGIKNL
jgi:hypothetical protein